MNKIIISLIISLFSTLTIVAQPSNLKKAGKSLMVLKTFDEKGNLLGSSNGFYVGNSGEAVSCYQPLKGATKAVVIGADGKERPVERIMGANETYDVAKFRVAGVKSQALSIAASSLRPGDLVWMMTQKDAKNVKMGTVRKVERFNNEYDYYTVSMKMPIGIGGCPIFNDEGQVVALSEPSFNDADTLNYAVAARFADSLRISALSINDPALRAIRIPKDLPIQLSQAVVTLYLGASTQDSVTYAVMIDDFIKRFPSAPDGYYYRALKAFQRDDFDAVEKDMELSIKMSDQKDAAHYNYSRFIYEKVVMKPQLPFERWTLDKALSEAQQAFAASPLPAYQHQQAIILFAQQKYQEAADIYDELLKGPMRSAELFHEASRCRIMQSDTIGQLAMLDSALNTFSKPYLRTAAPYLLARAQALLSAEKYRDAVMDLNMYEELMKNMVNDQFYYLRYQADLGGRLFQPALNDINKAIEMRSGYDVYYSEKASLLVRVGLLDEAIETAEQLIKLSPKQSDGYLFIGLAQCLKGDKENGLQQLKKALEMGDPQAEDLMKRFQ